MLASKGLRDRRIVPPSPELERSPAMTIYSGTHNAAYGFGELGEINAYKSPSIYAVLNRRARAIAALQWSVYRDAASTEQHEREKVPSWNWLCEILKKPNPLIARSSIWRLITNWEALNGNAYVYAPVGDFGFLPTQWWVLPSHRVRIVPGRDVPILGYIFRSDIGDMPIDARDVLHFKNLEPDTDSRHSFYLGKSLVASALESIGVEVSALRYQSRYLENDAAPSLVVSFPQDVDPDEFAAMKRDWRSMYAGANKKGKTVFLDQGGSVAPINSSNQLKDMQALIPQLLDQICMVTGIPSTALNFRDLNYATAVAMEQQIHSGTIRPQAQYMAEEVTLWAQRFDAELFVEPDDPSFLDPIEKRNNMVADLDNGVTTINEIRADRGEDPLPGGDVPRIKGAPIDGTAAPAAIGFGGKSRTLLNENGLPIDALPTPQDVQAPLTRQTTDYWYKIDALNERAATGLQHALSRFVTAWADTYTPPVTATDVQQRALPPVDNTPTQSDLHRKAVAAVDAQVRAQVEEAYRQAVEDAGGDWDEMRDELLFEMDETVADMEGSIMDSIDVMEAELAGLDLAGLPAEAVNEKIQSKFSFFAVARVALVARTLTTMGRTWSQLASWRKMSNSVDGDKEIVSVWRGEMDNRERDTHVAREGMLIGDDDTFDGLLPGEEANCRCTLEPEWLSPDERAAAMAEERATD